MGHLWELTNHMLCWKIVRILEYFCGVFKFVFVKSGHLDDSSERDNMYFCIWGKCRRADDYFVR